MHARLAGPPLRALLGLFHPSHMAVAFDKVGAGRYSDELALPVNQALRDQPMLDDMTRLATLKACRLSAVPARYRSPSGPRETPR